MAEQADGMGIVHVFVGPSCPAAVLNERFPQARLDSPTKHGDLFAPDIRAGDTVVIVDGLYHQTLALRHKEVLDAIERGVTVIGAGSIGAFRAVELGPFGMIGVGAVFGWYSDGVFEGDDAVAHADGDGYTAVSVPLVDSGQRASLVKQWGAPQDPWLENTLRDSQQPPTVEHKAEVNGCVNLTADLGC
ncbi:TfuA-like protein [Streptomyces sp. 2A115]|uniref:TfuA-like protein n=1 Tax=Streptomyces sp. 2A115 TaxID=3457439 RepID=UPI003FD09871